MIEQIMNVTEELKGTVMIYRVKGKLDTTLAPALEKQIFQYLNEEQNKILLDLTDVTYINSSGFRMLLSIKKQTKQLAGTLVVCCLRSEVLEMIKICGFDHVLDIAKTEEEALRKF